jgi:hypothetical protein
MTLSRKLKTLLDNADHGNWELWRDECRRPECADGDCACESPEVDVVRTSTGSIVAETEGGYANARLIVGLQNAGPVLVKVLAAVEVLGAARVRIKTLDSAALPAAEAAHEAAVNEIDRLADLLAAGAGEGVR